MPSCHRSHSTGSKCQVVAEYHAGETLHAFGRRHDLSRDLIRIRIEKAEAGALDEDAAAAELLTEYEARIAAHVRPCSGGIESTCRNGEVVPGAFIVDAHDREIISWR